MTDYLLQAALEPVAEDFADSLYSGVVSRWPDAATYDARSVLFDGVKERRFALFSVYDCNDKYLGCGLFVRCLHGCHGRVFYDDDPNLFRLFATLRSILAPVTREEILH